MELRDPYLILKSGPFLRRAISALEPSSVSGNSLNRRSTFANIYLKHGVARGRILVPLSISTLGLGFQWAPAGHLLLTQTTVSHRLRLPLQKKKKKRSSPNYIRLNIAPWRLGIRIHNQRLRGFPLAMEARRRRVA